MSVRQYSKKAIVSQTSVSPARPVLKSRPFAPQLKPDNTFQAAPHQQHNSTTPATYSLAQLAISSSNGSSSLPIQTKMEIGAPGDKYEQEADRVAQQVVSQIQSSSQSTTQDAVQRADLEEEDLQMKPLTDSIQRDDMLEEEDLQMKPLADSIQRNDMMEEEDLQMKSLVQRQEGAMDASPDIEREIEQSRGNGQTLDDSIRQPMEQAFGADFSHVRVHTGGQSDQLNRAIQAKAFTTGRDIFFRQGEYQPSNRGGQELLAHELTHVIQQSGRS